jgi:hypothetical protein
MVVAAASILVAPAGFLLLIRRWIIKFARSRGHCSTRLHTIWYAWTVLTTASKSSCRPVEIKGADAADCVGCASGP